VAKKRGLVFSATDYYGNLVKLYRDTWENHVLDPVNGHPQMLGCENLVQGVLKDPYEIRQSAQQATAAAFISATNVGPSLEGIRVLVNYTTNDFQKGSAEGLVVTAYPIDSVRYSTPRISRPLYKKPVKGQ